MSTIRAGARMNSAGVLLASTRVTMRPLNYGRVSRRLLGPVCFKENEDKKSMSENVAKKVDQTAAKVSHNMSGFLSSPSTQSTSYWALGTVAAATGVAALVVPSLFAGAIFQASTDAVVDAMVRMTGATLLTTAATKYTLKEAAGKEELTDDTHKLLNLALMVQSALCLMVLAQGISVRTPYLLGFLGPVCGAGLVLSARVYSLAKGGIPFPSLKHTLSGVLSTFMPATPASTGYSLLTIAMVSMAAMGLSAAPGANLELYNGVMGPMTVFMRRVAGAGMLAMALVAFSLKEVADKGALGTRTSRWLNLGLCSSMLAMAAVHIINMQSGLMLVTSKGYAMLGAMLAGFGYTGYQYVAASDKEKPAAA